MASSFWVEDRINQLRSFLSAAGPSLCGVESHEGYEDNLVDCPECMEDAMVRVETVAESRGDSLADVLDEMEAEADRLKQDLADMKHQSVAKSAVYDEKIVPLIKKLRAACRDSDVPLFLLCQLDDVRDETSDKSALVSSAWVPGDACTVFDYLGFLLTHGPEALAEKVIMSKISALAESVGASSGSEEDGDVSDNDLSRIMRVGKWTTGIGEA